ncbi:MAG: hypothetical protein GDA40_05855 [Rhodobacteraceae bacterium]|nr:hypothetical protein [Paracoccaceae bacterium]
MALEAFNVTPWGVEPVVRDVPRKDQTVFAAAAIVGPTGPLASDSFRCGLYYQRPYIRYGLHSHAAVETYAFIAGRALWTAGDLQQEVAPGDHVHHTTYLPHDCETGPEGLIALWRWSGDIGTESYRMHHGQGAFGRQAA